MRVGCECVCGWRAMGGRRRREEVLGQGTGRGSKRASLLGGWVGPVVDRSWFLHLMMKPWR